MIMYLYSDLIELLLECRLQLEYLNEKFEETGTTTALLAKLNDIETNLPPDQPKKERSFHPGFLEDGTFIGTD